MSKSFDFTPERLQAHAQSMRDLARQLLRDEGHAEDVVQETWMTLLKQPPGTPNGGSLINWLHGVVGNLARNKRRGQRRLAVRESNWARELSPESRNAASESRGHIMREVTDAVMALAEPYRSVVLLRYFENLPPRKIAAQHGVSVSTIKSQLQRAHAKLRDALARDPGMETAHWKRQLGLAFGLPWLPQVDSLPKAETGAALTTGSVGLAGTLLPFMTLLLNLKVLSLVAAAGLTALYLFESKAPIDSKPAQQAAQLATHALSRPAPTPPLQEEASRRETIGPNLASAGGSPGRAKGSPAQHWEYRISGQAFDSDDRPLAHVELFLGPDKQSLNRVGQTNSNGEFDLEFSAKMGSLDMLLGVGGSDPRGPHLQALAFESGHTQDVRLSAQGVTYAFIAIGASQFEPFELESTLVSGFPGTIQGPSRIARSQVQPDGSLVFVNLPHGSLNSSCPKEAQSVEAALGEVATSEAFESIRATSILRLGTFESAARNDDPPTAWLPSLTGIIYDIQGRPKSKVLIDLGGNRRTRSDAQGHYSFFDLNPGAIDLCAGGGDMGWVQEKLVLLAGKPMQIDLHLDRGLEFRRRLTDPEGNPLGQHEVRLSTRFGNGGRGLWEDQSTTDASGRIAIPNCPPGLLTLHVYPTQESCPLPAHSLKGLSARSHGEGTEEDESYITIVLEEEPLGALLFSLAEADGSPLRFPFQARLQHEQSGFFMECNLSKGASFRGPHSSTSVGLEPRTHGQVQFDHLPSGSYQLLILAGALGEIPYGQVYVAPGETTDLGALLLFEPARLVLDIEDESQREALAEAKLTLFRVGRMIDSHAGELLVRHNNWTNLGPGNYRIEASLAGMRTSLEFALQSKRTQGLALSLEAGTLALELVPHKAPLELPATLPAEGADCRRCHVR